MKFTVLGPPMPKERPRLGRRGVFTPRSTSAYERKVKFAAMAAGARPIASGDVCLSIAIYFPDRRRRDADNVFKAISDAGNGVLYSDDSQVKEGHFSVGYDKERPRVDVWVEPRSKTLVTVEAG